MHTKLELYERVTPLAGLGIFERNFMTGEFYWNKIIREILEVDESFSPELEVSLSFYKHPDLIHNLLNDAIKSGKPETADLELIGSEGTLKWVRVRVQADYKNGECIRIYGTLEDISENIKLLNLLEEREKRFSNAFDFAPIGMALVSTTGSWIKVNTNLCKLFGYSESYILNHTFQDFTHPDDLDKDLSNLYELLNDTIESYSIEKRYFHKDGHVIWALLNVSLVRDEMNEPLYFVSQIKDISERKKNLETIRDQNSRLLNFAHIVSHNLRSHTGNMQMLTNMILQEEDHTEREKLVEMLNVNAGNLLGTLDNLNEVVKVHDNGQTGKMQLNLGHEIKRVIDILAPTVKQSQAEIILDQIGEVFVDFSPAYLESILINLISNALKYRRSEVLTKITIRVRRESGYVKLIVTDNGLGIDLILHGHKLFGMYQTFHKHPDARGMGLFLVKNQVEAMGGRICVESVQGQGTTFTIEFN